MDRCLYFVEEVFSTRGREARLHHQGLTAGEARKFAEFYEYLGVEPNVSQFESATLVVLERMMQVAADVEFATAASCASEHVRMVRLRRGIRLRHEDPPRWQCGATPAN